MIENQSPQRQAGTGGFSVTTVFSIPSRDDEACEERSSSRARLAGLAIDVATW